MGRNQADRALLGSCLDGAGRLVAILFDQRAAHLEAAGAEKGVGHASDHEKQVGRFHERLQGLDLAADLGAAEDRGERSLRIVEQAAERLHFGVHQPPRDSHAHGGRDAGRRGVGAVCRAEGVADVEISEGHQLRHEVRVVGGLPGMEAEVLEQADVPVAERVDRPASGFADAVGAETDRLAEELRQALSHGLEGEVEVELAVGAAAVGQEDDTRAPPLQLAHGRQRLHQAGVVEHAAVAHRHVEVDAHEGPLAGDLVVGEVVESRQSGRGKSSHVGSGEVRFWGQEGSARRPAV